MTNMQSLSPGDCQISNRNGMYAIGHILRKCYGPHIGLCKCGAQELQNHNHFDMVFMWPSCHKVAKRVNIANKAISTNQKGKPMGKINQTSSCHKVLKGTHLQV